MQFKSKILLEIKTKREIAGNILQIKQKPQKDSLLTFQLHHLCLTSWTWNVHNLLPWSCCLICWVFPTSYILFLQNILGQVVNMGLMGHINMFLLMLGANGWRSHYNNAGLDIPWFWTLQWTCTMQGPVWFEDLPILSAIFHFVWDARWNVFSCKNPTRDLTLLTLPWKEIVL